MQVKPQVRFTKVNWLEGERFCSYLGDQLFANHVFRNLSFHSVLITRFVLCTAWRNRLRRRSSLPDHDSGVGGGDRNQSFWAVIPPDGDSAVVRVTTTTAKIVWWSLGGDFALTLLCLFEALLSCLIDPPNHSADQTRRWQLLRHGG